MKFDASKWNKCKLNTLFSGVFYILFIFFFNFHFMTTTMLFPGHLDAYNPIFVKIYDIGFYVLFVLAILSLLLLFDNITSRLFPLGIIFVSILFNHNRNVTTFRVIAVFLLLLVASKGKKFVALGWIAFSCGWIWLIASYIGTRVGYIVDLTYENGSRHALGSIYPTDLGCHILTLSMVLCIIRKGKLSLVGYLYLFFTLGINLLFIHAKVSFCCTVLLFFATVFNQFIVTKSQINKGVIKLSESIFIASFVFFAILTIYLTATYDSDSLINKISVMGSIKSRFKFGRIAFDNYPVTKWGVVIPENGGGGKQGDNIANYFYIDISYVRILMLHGLVIFLVTMILYTKIQVRLVKNKLLYYACILSLFSLDCAVEHHIIETAYALLAFLLFTDLPGSSERIYHFNALLDNSQIRQRAS